MKRIIAILVLLGIVAGCAGLKRRSLMPKPYPTNQQEYLAGFTDGYRGVRPLDPHAQDRRSYSSAGAYHQGLRDGYATGRKDEIQRK
jgi:energy-converting hydrogenase Eha subunit F